MTFQLVLRPIGRVLWFAVAGAICMAIVGAVAGSVTGALVVLVENLTRRGSSHILSNMGIGTFVGAAYATSVGICSGFIAFMIAGLFACFSQFSQKVFTQAFRLAWRTVIIGVVIGAFLGVVNVLFFARMVSSIKWDWFEGYVYGVLGGLALGTFYGAIIGAKRELARQKLETKNAALSVVENAALVSE